MTTSDKLVKTVKYQSRKISGVDMHEVDDSSWEIQMLRRRDFFVYKFVFNSHFRTKRGDIYQSTLDIDKEIPLSEMPWSLLLRIIWRKLTRSQ